MNGIAAGYYRFCVHITRFAYLNLLWLLFTIAGLGVFGIMPSTAAMFSVVRKWLRGDEDTPITKVFWKTYKNEFVRANMVGMMMLVIGYFFYLELQILWAQQSTIYHVASFGVLALLAIYFVALLYLFPVFVHFELTVIDYLKWPIVIGIVHPILTLFLGGSLLIIYYISLSSFPAVLYIFGGSVTAYILTWGASKTFDKYEVHHPQSKQGQPMTAVDY